MIRLEQHCFGGRVMRRENRPASFADALVVGVGNRRLEAIDSLVDWLAVERLLEPVYTAPTGLGVLPAEAGTHSSAVEMLKNGSRLSPGLRLVLCWQQVDRLGAIGGTIAECLREGS